MYSNVKVEYKYSMSLFPKCAIKATNMKKRKVMINLINKKKAELIKQTFNPYYLTYHYLYKKDSGEYFILDDNGDILCENDSIFKKCLQYFYNKNSVDRIDD